MSVIAWIVIGLLPGWLATRIMCGRDAQSCGGSRGRDRQRVPVREAANSVLDNYLLTTT
jgi:hypothetical protein